MKTHFLKLIIILIVGLNVSACQDDGVSHELKGEWKLQSSCGGFSGGCSYADKNYSKTLKITSSKIVLVDNNSKITTTRSYQLTDRTEYKDYSEYKIEFEDETYWRITVINDELSVELGDFWENYKKSKHYFVNKF